MFVFRYFKGKSLIVSSRNFDARTIICFLSKTPQKKSHTWIWITFFSLDTESIIAGVWIASLARCTEYPGSLGFLFSRSQAEIYVHLSPVTFSWACPSAPVRLPSLCLDHAWACSLAMQRGKIPFCMMSELKHQSKAEHSLREVLNSLSTNNSRNEEHFFHCCCCLA